MFFGLYIEIISIFQNIKLNDIIVLDKSINTSFNKYSTSAKIVGDDFSIIKEHIKKRELKLSFFNFL